MSATSRSQPSIEELKDINQRFEGQTPQEVLAYGLGQYFPGIVLACSFGPEDVVIWDMMHQINPESSFFYLDTDFLFKETHDVRELIKIKYSLRSEQII